MSVPATIAPERPSAADAGCGAPDSRRQDRLRVALVSGSYNYIKDGIALTFQPDILDAIARGKGPRRALVAVGYAGWAPGQLEAEMKTGAWARASADEALIFDGDDDTKWDRAMARRKIDL